MKISYNWLKEYLDIPSEPMDLAGILTDLGLEVEGVEEIQSIPGGLKGLVVGQVNTCNKHPNADRLSLVTVDIGASGPLQIVCGAHNVAAGQKVVVAQVNTILHPTDGEPFPIKKGKIRGTWSEGMICSQDEIGIGEDHDGIIVLPDHLEIGSAVSDFYQVETDTIYDIGLTPNRSDATSHTGVAKDLLAHYRYHVDSNLKLKLPKAEIEVIEEKDKNIDVVIKDLTGCPRFSGLTLSHVKIGPSPDWMQRRLKAIGVRPISNIVDITNYVLHEYGQPLHAYDFNKISDRRIHVQTLPGKTEFRSLDEKVRSLHSEDLIVCDGHDKGLCIAGVFGGLDSGVTDNTTDIFLEAAFFNSLQLRKTSTRHQLRTDAAKCFEKGTDPAQTVTALTRAASLMCEYAGASVSSKLVDEYPQPIIPLKIKVNRDRVRQLIGHDISDLEITKIFDALNMKVTARDDQSTTVSIPTNKADVTREADVIEEILRIYGYNNVPTPQRLNTTIIPSQRIDTVRLRNLISQVLIYKGYNEMMGLSLIPSSLYTGISDYENHLVKVNNTSNVHLDAMRPEMMLSALLASQHNINRQQKTVALFENGRSYQKKSEGHEEVEWMTLLRTGDLFTYSWRPSPRPNDFYDIKEGVLGIFTRLGIDNYQISELEDKRFAFGLVFHKGNSVLASLGAVSDKVKQAVDLQQDIFYAEMQISELVKSVGKRNQSIQEIPRFPSSKRDLALTLDEKIKYSVIEKIIRKHSGTLLKDVALFDIYRDVKLKSQGKKSYAVSMTFEDSEKNLKDKVIDKIVAKLVDKLQSEVGAVLR